jgi:hypothetical protein
MSLGLIIKTSFQLLRQNPVGGRVSIAGPRGAVALHHRPKFDMTVQSLNTKVACCLAWTDSDRDV